MADWKAIPSEAGYEVSDDGRVRSVDRVVLTANGQSRSYKGKELSPGCAKSGHLTVACGKGNSRYVHALMLEAHVGPCPEGHECLHADDVPDHNILPNLRWGTRSENLIDCYANGRR